MTDGSVTIDTPDGEMSAFTSRPVGPVKGAIVVIQEAYGLTSHIQNICRRLTDAGWFAIAPALFHRQGSPVIPYNETQRAMGMIKALDFESIATDTDATFEYVASQGFAPEDTGIVGFCMGGSAVIYINARPSLGAAVSFYGAGIREGRFGMPPLLELAPQMKSPWLGLFGDEDNSIPPEQVEELRIAVKEAPVPTEIVRYAGAGHAFNCDERPANFHEQSARDAWNRTLAWFDQYVA